MGSTWGSGAGRTVAEGLPVAASCLTPRVGAWRGLGGCPGRRRQLPALLFSVIQKYCFRFSPVNWKVLSVPIIQQMMNTFHVEALARLGPGK